MFNTKSLIVALTLATVTISANAKDYEATVVSDGQYTFGNSAPLPSFTDWVSFDVTTSGNFVGSLSGTSSTSFSLTAFDLYDSAKNLVVSGDFNNIGGVATVGLANGFTPAGSYFLYVAGNTAGGTYNGNISITAVPEPETYALMLAGLGLIGVAARRRNS